MFCRCQLLALFPYEVEILALWDPENVFCLKNLARSILAPVPTWHYGRTQEAFSAKLLLGCVPDLALEPIKETLHVTIS